jgi:multisubunit Na+/H+ antiporter MnhF subunit
MNDAVFYIALVWMMGLLLTTLVMVIRATSMMSRILALDAVTLVLTALLVLYSTTTKSSYYVDAAIALGLLSFISTMAAARYYSEGRIF